MMSCLEGLGLRNSRVEILPNLWEYRIRIALIKGGRILLKELDGAAFQVLLNSMENQELIV